MKIIRFLIIAVVIIAAFFVFRSTSEPNYVNLPPSATGEWVAFGDSLTSGYGAGEGSDYPSLLSQQLGIPIHNLGVPGNTTQDGLGRLNDVLRLKPRVVLLGLGGNDGLRNVPAEQTFNNLAAIIDELQQAGSFVVLIGIRSATFRDSYASKFEKLAHEKGAFLVPNILDGVLGSPKLMSDYIHPNDAGYRAIADRLEGELRPLLSQLQ